MAFSTLEKINMSVETDVDSFIRNSEMDFDKSVSSLVDSVTADNDCDIVLLAGPSSSGKTTTASMIAKKVAKKGKNAYIVSLDDYYHNVNDIPLTESGLKDFENVSALDIGLIHESFNDLIEKREAEIPKFDFMTGMRSAKTEKVRLGKDDMIIVEGIHALNPIITRGLDEGHINKVYISVSTRVTDSGKVLFSKRNLRLVRRMIRDYHYRNTSVEKTLSQWPEVLKGEDKYIFPYEKNARFRIDSFHRYEPCLFRNEALELLNTVDENSEFYPTAYELKKDFEKLFPINMSKLPENSLLREFV